MIFNIFTNCKIKPRSKRTKSCPPGAKRSVYTGPWSVEWLHDRNQGDAGVIFSGKRRTKKGEHQGRGHQRVENLDPKRRKAGGPLRHSLFSLKKVARLPSEDRSEVLKILSKSVRRRRGGKGLNQSGVASIQASSEESSASASVNNDWKNWVVMQGNDQVPEDDVRAIGKSIGVEFKGASENRYSVLFGGGKSKQECSGQGQGGFISWNIRGLGGVEKRKEVRKLVEDLNPFLVCLQETKLQFCEDSICSSLWGNSDYAYSYRPSVGASGGLLTIWNSEEIEVWSTESRRHVLWCHGRFIKSGEEFFVANVYAPCDNGAKQDLWDSLSARLQTLERRRVCVCGDFNAVRSVDERRSLRSGHRFLDHIPFNRFIEDNILIDLPLSGRKFTWYKGDGLSMSRLDRFLLSEEWCLDWPNCMQGPRPSRMLKCWKDIPGYNRFVKDKWFSFQLEGWGGYVLKEKLKLIKLALKDWHKTHTENWPSRIESLKGRLSTLDQKGEEEHLSEAELVELHGVSSDIHSLSRLHASISWQQSRSLWLKEGDANTKYFHSVLASRRRGNAISSIQVDSATLEGVNPIRQAVVSHFESHFKASNVERPGVDNLAFKRLNQSEQVSLTMPFTAAEVKMAVWNCESYKSPGPDGINFGFIKDFWNELQGDVMRFISKFHRNGKLTKGLNSTFIALIPKIDSPQRLNDFRPISLVGCLYKILAKVLANRLRLVIGSVISESQTAFVKERQILDGILIANEVVDEARKSKKELMLFKVDFEKAYDSVDWGYLDDVMGRMSFPTLWRKWIKECICTASASILVNGSPTEEFPLERGLRQGDPLSPFLFLLATEGLHVLMEAMVDRHLFTGYKVGEVDQVSISHLQFADDTLLLGVKSWANVRALRAVLVLFEAMSGLKVNFNKSMLVGVNIAESWLCEAASSLCCRVGNIPFLYLGLPIGGDPRRLGFWEPVLARLKNRLSGWKSRFLSFGGRLTLLKSVLTSLPVYALSFFKAPSGFVVSSVGSSLRGGERESERGRAERSPWWREIVRIRDTGGGLWGGWFGENISKKVGKGSDTFFWTDPWVAEIPLCEKFGRLFDLAEAKSATVAEMFASGWGAGGEAWVWRRQLRGWEEEELRECQILLSTLSLQVHSSDSWQWQPDPGTGYSVRGAYHLLTSQDSVTLDDAAGLIWHPQVPLKVSIFAWRLLQDSICGSLWSLISSWIGSPLVDSQTLSAHFLQFTSSAGVSRAHRSFMQLIWLACVWVMWHERNQRLFRGSSNSLLQMLDKIKLITYRWLKATSSTLALNYHS
ncbi:hypothetical protein TSUD_132230 [Trifolium subterraneum]|uniref:Reverse transcriptase domain-containing protein n=1 Tax=Trifolium subterraneum TaxID=3900 RepID=A0A2Z6M291_TRISU|nr:hypothetical protein TSUD_132230 [Trifolium subterraneum]